MPCLLPCLWGLGRADALEAMGGGHVKKLTMQEDYCKRHQRVRLGGLCPMELQHSINLNSFSSPGGSADCFQ